MDKEILEAALAGSSLAFSVSFVFAMAIALYLAQLRRTHIIIPNDGYDTEVVELRMGQLPTMNRYFRNKGYKFVSMTKDVTKPHTFYAIYVRGE